MSYNQLITVPGEGSLETCQLVKFLKSYGSSEKFKPKYYSIKQDYEVVHNYVDDNLEK